MTGYAIRHVPSGSYLDVRDKGVVQHVDRIEHARQFRSTVSALVAADVLGLDLGDYDVVQVEDAPQAPPPAEAAVERMTKQ